MKIVCSQVKWFLLYGWNTQVQLLACKQGWLKGRSGAREFAGEQRSTRPSCGCVLVFVGSVFRSFGPARALPTAGAWWECTVCQRLLILQYWELTMIRGTTTGSAASSETSLWAFAWRQTPFIVSYWSSDRAWLQSSLHIVFLVCLGFFFFTKQLKCYTLYFQTGSGRSPEGGFKTLKTILTITQTCDSKCTSWNVGGDAYYMTEHNASKTSVSFQLHPPTHKADANTIIKQKTLT